MYHSAEKSLNWINFGGVGNLHQYFTWFLLAECKELQQIKDIFAYWVIWKT